ncbi:MAG TPA: SGNH/GDSL hydrolase family protein [Saprospiraceae bacterium]|nr:SGNH/GDSL hydrolase family protein [Saprospiraceae bacterium]
MQKLVFIFCLLGFQMQTYAQTYPIPNDVKRIVFLGNSITYQGQYIEYLEAYFLNHYPEQSYELINVGLPSETLSGLSEANHAGGAFPRPDLHDRLDRVLQKTKPDLVFSCYGMNDGIYLPFDESRFEKFKTGIRWLQEEVENTGAKIIHITPPIYDERRGAAYANVLDIYSAWLISQRYTKDWKVINMHWPMRKALEDRRQRESSFVFAKDGIHPTADGHFFMALQILKGVGEEDLTPWEDRDGFLSNQANREKILDLIHQKQVLMKNAWLTYIGHQRPRMPEGISMDVARQQSEEINQQLRALLRKR